MLYLAGISIAIFLGLLLFSKKGKTAADKILAVWLVVIAIHLFLYYLYISANVFEYPVLLGLGLPIPLMHGPFLFLYVATLTGRLAKPGVWEVVHFVPALMAYVFIFPFFLRPAEEKIYVFQHKGVGYETFIAINLVAIILSGVGYVVWSVILLNRHRSSILDQFSSTEKINLLWLQYLIYGIALIWVFVILNKDYLVYSTAVLFVLFIGYFGIRQVGIFAAQPPSNMDPLQNSGPPPPSEPPVNPPTSGAGEPEQKKYSKSGLTEEGAAQLHQKLSDLMSSEKLYLESELTLAALAGRLNTAPNYLSQVINEREGKNFYDYINTLRIEEFKRVALEPANQRFTLLAMAYDCGFSSKSSFNKYFRKITGLSPMEFVKQTG